jgi:uncharacterized tellurite resistance protein B-like protein
VFFDRRNKLDQGSGLEAAVRRLLPSVDGDTQRIVAAIVGLCGVVAYADRDFCAAEQQSLVQVIAGMQGMTLESAAQLVTALGDQIVAVSSTELARHARTMMELAERDLRLHTLELLLDLAAADDSVTQEEVVVLRQVTKALGLDQRDYNRLQTKHRERLQALG